MTAGIDDILGTIEDEAPGMMLLLGTCVAVGTIGAVEDPTAEVRVVATSDEVVLATVCGGKVVVFGDGESVLVVSGLKPLVVGEGVDAALPGVSGEDSGLDISPATLVRMNILRSSAMDCPRRVPRLRRL